MYIFTVIFSISLFAKDFEYKFDYKSNKVNCCVANYELCLKHENDGVVESSLVNVIKFKYRRPDADYDCIMKQLKQLSQNHENKRISQKAELVLQILQNSELVMAIGDNFYADIDQFLNAIILSSKFEHELTINLNR